LGALIPGGEEEAAEQRAGGLRMVTLDSINPNPRQPRSMMDDAALDELAASIEEHGLIQPLIVNEETDGRYTLIAGERRWRASQRAGLLEVPVVVKEASPQAMLELALIENIQRADLNPLEEATAYRQLMDEFGLTQSQVAQRVGKSRPAVANYVRLLDLPPEVQEAVVAGELSGGHARTLLGLMAPDQQVTLMRTVIGKDLSVRQTEAIVRLVEELPPKVQQALLLGNLEAEHAEVLLRLPDPERQVAMMQTILNKGLSVQQTSDSVEKQLAGMRPRSRASKKPAPEMMWLESQFQQTLGTRVNIQKSGEGGRVVIHFYSNEELQAIFEAIVGEA
jgi:ParB family chromosome partitioning protein